VPCAVLELVAIAVQFGDRSLEAKHVVVSLTDLYAAMCEAKADIEADLRQEFGDRPTGPSNAFLRADIDL
jgi:hypothetical protein